MRRLSCGLILVFACSSHPLGADDQLLRLQIGHVSSATNLFNSGGVTLGVENAAAGRIAFEHMFTDKLGIEAGLGTSQHDFTLLIVNGVRRGSEFRLTPLTLGGNLHFGDSRRVDPFFGAGLAYVMIDDFSRLNGLEEASVDPEFTWFLQYGMDIALGKLRRSDPTKKRWNLGLAISYMNFEAEAVSQPLPIETINIYAGVTWRWE